MMDLEKLIEAVKLCGRTPKADQCKQCAYWAGGDMGRCIPNMTGDAATALSALQAENEELRVEVEYEKEHANAYYEECEEWEAENKKLRAELEQARKDCAVAEKNHADCIDELEQVKRERDAAISSWRGFCVKCDWNGKQYLGDGQMDVRCRTCRENGKCNWHWREQKED